MWARPHELMLTQSPTETTAVVDVRAFMEQNVIKL